MKKHVKIKKAIVLILLVIAFVLFICEGADFLSTIIIKSVAILSMGSCSYLFKHWRLADDPTIHKLIEE